MSCLATLYEWMYKIRNTTNQLQQLIADSLKTKGLHINKIILISAAEAKISNGHIYYSGSIIGNIFNISSVPLAVNNKIIDIDKKIACY
jgi:hypothetical protein